jgi:hypothetical protein
MTALTFIVLATAGLVSCGRARMDSAVPSHVDDGVVLIVENRTSEVVRVFFVEAHSHTRLGSVPASVDAPLTVRPHLLHGRRSFRIYAFRGAEPCPVARVLDLDVSKTPRITVAPSDTVVRHYLPGDACVNKGATGANK